MDERFSEINNIRDGRSNTIVSKALISSFMFRLNTANRYTRGLLGDYRPNTIMSKALIFSFMFSHNTANKY